MRSSVERQVRMATGAMKEWDLVLSSELEGEPSKVQAILADWGMDPATISCMLSEHEAVETPRRNQLDAEAFDGHGSHIEDRNDKVGTGWTGLRA
jgi:hypothetical protein